MTPPRVDVLGVGISAVDIPSAVDRLGRWVDERADRYVCVTGVHGVMESQDDGELKTIHNRAGMVTPDGMPLVWLGRIGGPTADGPGLRPRPDARGVPPIA